MSSHLEQEELTESKFQVPKSETDEGDGTGGPESGGPESVDGRVSGSGDGAGGDGAAAGAGTGGSTASSSKDEASRGSRRLTTRLGRLLVDFGLITRSELDQALDAQKQQGGRLGHVLVEMGLVEEQDLIRLLSEQYGVPAADLDDIDVPSEYLASVPAEMARRFNVVPIDRDGKVLHLAMVDPTDVHAIDDIEFATGLRVQPMVASERALTEAIERFYGGHQEAELRRMMQDLERDQREASDLEIVEDDEEIDLSELEQATGEAPVIKLVNVLLTDALRRGASDIHIEPYEKRLRVRYRVDGVLYEIMDPPKRMQHAIASRIKIMSQLDISERRRPQDGRIKLRIRLDGRTRELDLRVSTLPTMWGEKIVMRLLDPESLMLDMAKLGFEKWSLEKFRRAIESPYGIVLVTGPTGSGKTNTLYSALSNLNTPDTNIMTAEDPVEFNLPGINQVQVRESVGLDFAASLRSFLRQDPDIILVGEVRDGDTADMAVKAALTGHLVLSTLHTNDAPSALTRLSDMGVEPFLVSSSLQLVVAQRLVRRLCKKCRTVSNTSPEALMEVGFSPEDAPNITIYQAEGCPDCNETGYRGRIGLFEVMPISETTREMVLNGASSSELRAQARSEGMITLRESGLAKVWQGTTTIEEVLGATAD